MITSSVQKAGDKRRARHLDGGVVNIGFGTGEAERRLAGGEKTFDVPDSVLNQPSPPPVLTDHED